MSNVQFWHAANKNVLWTGAVIARKAEPMLIMEYMELGSLYDLLHNDSMVLDGEIVLPILRDIARGLRFLHAADPQIVHGDMKAQNVLVDTRFHAKVADFGLSQKNRFGRSSSCTGTPFWMAPELLRRETSNNTSSDVYAFGIVLYELYSRKEPYEGEHHEDVLRLVADKTVNKRPPVPSACPHDAADLMTACLRSVPEERPSAEDIDIRLKMLDVGNVSPEELVMSRQNRKKADMERTEDLLSQLFPAHIAKALRDGRKVEPETLDCVTVFFSDIVGYTKIAGTLSPTKVSDLLDRLYTKFDALSGTHNVFKVRYRHSFDSPL